MSWTVLAMLGATLPPMMWSAPPECPSQSAFAQTLSDALQGSQQQLDPTMVLEIEVTRLKDEWHLSLAMRRGEARIEREWTDVTCATLLDAAAFMVTLAGVERSSPPVEARRPVPSVRQPAAADPPAPLLAPRETQIGVRVQGAVDVGSLPEPTLGVATAILLTHAALHVVLEWSRWSSQTLHPFQSGDAGARFGLNTFGAELGWALAVGPLELVPGAMLSFERLDARGLTVRDPVHHVAWRTGLSACLAARYPLTTHWALWTEGRAGIVRSPVNYDVADVGRVFATRAWALRYQIGLAAFF